MSTLTQNTFEVRHVSSESESYGCTDAFTLSVKSDDRLAMTIALDFTDESKITIVAEHVDHAAMPGTYDLQLIIQTLQAMLKAQAASQAEFYADAFRDEDYNDVVVTFETESVEHPMLPVDHEDDVSSAAEVFAILKKNSQKILDTAFLAP